MLRFSKKVEYALISLLHMSQKKGEQLTSAAELSRQYHIPQELISKVLQRLAKEEFIRSVQGVKGGYFLGQPIDAISVSQIVSAIDGPMKIVSCLEHKQTDRCIQKNHCTIKNPMDIIQRRLDIFFDTLTLRDLQQELNSSSKAVEIL
jgi:Rrf2 family protein